MAKETVLISIEHTTKYPDGNIDFSITATDEIDTLITENKEEIIGMLEKLANRLRNGKYPFGF